MQCFEDDDEGDERVGWLRSLAFFLFLLNLNAIITPSTQGSVYDLQINANESRCEGINCGCVCVCL